MRLAVIKGASVNYSDYRDTVVIERCDGRVYVVRKEVFDSLYVRLTDFKAALKEECIEYVIHDTTKPLHSYPEWYILAVQDGWIYNDNGYYVFFDDRNDRTDEIPMINGSIMLRNKHEDLMYLERHMFDRYYEIMEG